MNYYRARGAQAFRDGHPAKVNPYARGTERHKAWAGGWKRADLEHDERREITTVEMFNRRRAA